MQRDTLIAHLHLMETQPHDFILQTVQQFVNGISIEEIENLCVKWYGEFFAIEGGSLGKNESSPEIWIEFNPDFNIYQLNIYTVDVCISLFRETLLRDGWKIDNDESYMERFIG